MAGVIVAAVVCALWMFKTMARLEVELYAAQTVVAVYRAIEQLAYDHADGQVDWLKGATATELKSDMVMLAYRRMPAMVGVCPAWAVRALYEEQGFCDMVERRYEKARRMAIDVLDRKDDVKVDLD